MSTCQFKTSRLLPIIVLASLWGAQEVRADDGLDCKDIAACAQKMVKIVSRLADENAQLTKKVGDLETRLANDEGVIASNQTKDVQALKDGLEGLKAISVAAGAVPASETWGSVHYKDFNGSCPSGQVVIGIKQEFGGTCNQKCDGDGLPVRHISVVCGLPTVSH